MKRSTFCLCVVGMTAFMWLTAVFYVAEDVRVKNFYQGRLDEVVQQAACGETSGKTSFIEVRAYQNDGAMPMPEDQVTAVRFFGEQDFLFYKGAVAQEALEAVRKKDNRWVCNVIMGIFFGISVMMFLIARSEEKSKQEVFIVDARGD